ncbi:MAG: hypothetical protein ACLSG8_05050 [Barnesiella sp.]
MKGQAASRFGQKLPSAKSIQPENLFPFRSVLNNADGNGNQRLTEKRKTEKETAYRQV